FARPPHLAFLSLPIQPFPGTIVPAFRAEFPSPVPAFPPVPPFPDIPGTSVPAGIQMILDQMRGYGGYAFHPGMDERHCGPEFPAMHAPRHLPCFAAAMKREC